MQPFLQTTITLTRMHTSLMTSERKHIYRSEIHPFSDCIARYNKKKSEKPDLLIAYAYYRLALLYRYQKKLKGHHQMAFFMPIIFGR